MRNQERKKPSFLKQFARNFVLRSDMFAAQPTLRYSGQPCYETILGGILSIILVVAFAIIFYSSFYNILTKVTIIASNDIQDNPLSLDTVEDIKFAVGIQQIDCTAPTRYFGIFLDRVTRQEGDPPVKVQIELEACQKSDWVDYSEEMDELFDAYNMGKMLCPTSDAELQLQGFEGGDLWKTLQLRVQACDNSTATSYTCYSQPDIDTYFDAYVAANDFFKVKFYILDREISPTHEDYLTPVLQKQIFISFSHDLGSRGVVRLGNYQIITDESILPFPAILNETGHYLQSYQTHSIQLYSTHYARIQVEKSRKKYTVNRSHDKIDQMLSYVGGLFALIFGWLFFLCGSFSEYRYELSVAESSFSANQQGRKLREKSFGFFTYLRYAIFDWLKAFNIHPDWSKLKKIDQVRQQATEQLDVRYVIKQLQHFSRVNKLLLDQHRFICSYLNRPPTLQEVKQLRKICQYYDKVIKDECILEQSDDGKSEVKNQFGMKETAEEYQDDEPYAQDSDFDSDDEQAENTIAKAMWQLKAKKEKTLWREIPSKIKKRIKQKERYLETKHEKQSAQIRESSIISLHHIAKQEKDPKIFDSSKI